MDKKKIKNAVVMPYNQSSSPLRYSNRCETSDKFWRWGEDNLFPYALALMSRRSATHRRIINDKADYISGKGFTFDPQNIALKEFIDKSNSSGESLRQILHKLAYDKSLFGNAFLEVVTDLNHTFVSLHHQDGSRCRVARDSQHILLHHDWSNFRLSEARSLPVYPNFEQWEDGTLRSIVHYKEYEPMFTHYGVPNYVAGLNVSAIAYKTDCWNISRLDNAFQLSGVMMLDSSADSDEQVDRIVRNAEQKFAGNPGQVMFLLRDGVENDSSKFIPIESSSEGDWQALHEQAVGDIVVAHSWFRTLSGLDYGSGFNSERILHEYEIALNTLILSEQAEIIEPIKQVLTNLLAIDTTSLEIINHPPTNSKPLYMKIWEARKSDGLEYDAEDPQQQLFVGEITRYNLKSIE